VFTACKPARFFSRAAFPGTAPSANLHGWRAAGPGSGAAARPAARL